MVLALKRMVVALVLAVSVVGCSDFDESFGLDYTSSSQSMSMQTLTDNSSFETSLYRSEEFRNSNIGLVLMGAERRKVYGERRTSFFAEFIPVMEIDDSDDDWDEEFPFGYNPLFDSLMLFFSLKEYSGDTLVQQTFDVYEAKSTSFLDGRLDSIFYHSFDTTLLQLTNKPLFHFTFPDPDNEVYTTSNYVKLQPYEDNAEDVDDFINRLLLLDDNSTMDIYDLDQRELFLEKFKGIYIVPTTTYGTDEAASELESVGATYSMYVDGTGLGFYARSIYRDDISIIKDTINMTLAFREFSSTDIDDDYHGLTINKVTFDSDLTSGEESATMRVEGMGGVVSKISITQSLFEELDRVLSTTMDKNDTPYNTIFFNRAQLNIYITKEAGGNYDYTQLQPLFVTPWMDAMPTRLGLYSVYSDYFATEDDHDDDKSTLTGIEDYYYAYELSYSTILPYNGYLNRSLGCYEMIISAQLQEAWNSYLEAKESAGGDASLIDWDNDITERSFYVGPVADDCFTVKYASLQGMPDGELLNNAPLELKLTYTLVK